MPLLPLAPLPRRGLQRHALPRRGASDRELPLGPSSALVWPKGALTARRALLVARGMGGCLGHACMMRCVLSLASEPLFFLSQSSILTQNVLCCSISQSLDVWFLGLVVCD